MKIAFTSRGKDLDADIDPRFGRCQYFVIVDTETMDYDSVENASAMAMGGAGPQAAQAISEQGAEAVITGNVGPNAFQALEATGISVMTGAKGTVRNMVKKFKDGGFQETTAPSVGSHAGMR